MGRKKIGDRNLSLKRKNNRIAKKEKKDKQNKIGMYSRGKK